MHSALAPLRRDYVSARWVPPENYHITVHFFGEVSEYVQLIPKIEEALFEMPPFELVVLSGGVFQFPDLVLYVDFYRAKVLEKLARNLDERFTTGKLYRFIPHVTVARMRKPSKQQYLLVKKKMMEFTTDLQFEVSELSLFESVQAENGVRYEVLHTFTLEG